MSIIERFFTQPTNAVAPSLIFVIKGLRLILRIASASLLIKPATLSIPLRYNSFTDLLALPSFFARSLFDLLPVNALKISVINPAIDPIRLNNGFTNLSAPPITVVITFPITLIIEKIA